MIYRIYFRYRGRFEFRDCPSPELPIGITSAVVLAVCIKPEVRAR